VRRAVATLFAGSVGLTIGCGGAARAPAPPVTRASDAGVSLDAETRPDGGNAEALASLEELAARGPSEAPLMRERLRLEHAASGATELRAERDLCVRALYTAARPVRIWFADERGQRRGEIASGTGGAIPPRGPTCVRRGEVLRLVVEDGRADGAPGVAGGELGKHPEPSEPDARAVIFAAP
jgi:hypothetical protein